MGYLVASLVASDEHDIYRKKYKAYFAEQNLKRTFANLRYSREDGLSESLIKSIGMINTGDRLLSEDLIVAKYKNTQFFQSDVAIVVNGEVDVDIFKGRFMIFEFPKKFNFKLALVGRGFNAFKISNKNDSNNLKMKRIYTESSKFNKLFKIYAEDGLEARYILDPLFMTKIEKIADKYKSRLFFGFIDNHLVIGLNDYKNSFEPPKASKPINEQAEMEKIRSDIKVITDFVDELSLDRKIFKA